MHKIEIQARVYGSRGRVATRSARFRFRGATSDPLDGLVARAGRIAAELVREAAEDVGPAIWPAPPSRSTPDELFRWARTAQPFDQFRFARARLARGLPDDPSSWTPADARSIARELRERLMPKGSRQPCG